jgi:hypothetical protein
VAQSLSNPVDNLVQHIDQQLCVGTELLHRANQQIFHGTNEICRNDDTLIPNHETAADLGINRVFGNDCNSDDLYEDTGVLSNRQSRAPPNRPDRGTAYEGLETPVQSIYADQPAPPAVRFAEILRKTELRRAMPHDSNRARGLLTDHDGHIVVIPTQPPVPHTDDGNQPRPAEDSGTGGALFDHHHLANGNPGYLSPARPSHSLYISTSQQYF